MSVSQEQVYKGKFRHLNGVNTWYEYEDWVFPSEESTRQDKEIFIHWPCFTTPPGIDGFVAPKDVRFWRKMTCWACGAKLPAMVFAEYIRRLW